MNKADAIVTGGSEAAVNEMGMGGFNALKALSTRNDSPETASRPFDQGLVTDLYLVKEPGQLF